MVKKYVPERGDIVWLDFNPTKGHEQKGRRPSVVLSPVEYNDKSNLALFCPITSISKKYPFEVVIKEKEIQGIVLVDQIKSFDWGKRKIEFVCKTNKETFVEIIQKALVLIK